MYSIVLIYPSIVQNFMCCEAPPPFCSNGRVNVFDWFIDAAFERTLVL